MVCFVLIGRGGGGGGGRYVQYMHYMYMLAGVHPLSIVAVSVMCQCNQYRLQLLLAANDTDQCSLVRQRQSAARRVLLGHQRVMTSPTTLYCLTTSHYIIVIMMIHLHSC